MLRECRVPSIERFSMGNNKVIPRVRMQKIVIQQNKGIFMESMSKYT